MYRDCSHARLQNHASSFVFEGVLIGRVDQGVFRFILGHILNQPRGCECVRQQVAQTHKHLVTRLLMPKHANWVSNEYFMSRKWCAFNRINVYCTTNVEATAFLLAFPASPGCKRPLQRRLRQSRRLSADTYHGQEWHSRHWAQFRYSYCLH